jgi:hypothetical protein
MPTSKKRPVAGLNAAEGLPRSIRRPVCLVLRSIPLISIKPFTYLLVSMLLLLFCVGPAIADTDYWVPWVTKTTTNSATINWRGADTGSGSVEYATSSYYEEHHSFQHTVTSETTGAYQHVALAGLEPNTAYVYRARPSDNPDQFSNRAFKTMPVSGPFTFLVISDSHAQEKRFKYVADAIAKYETDPLFILDGGDYTSWDYEPFWSVYFQYADGMLAKFPLFHAIGNHEYHNYVDKDAPPTHADQYRWTFDVPEDGALNYSFDCADIRFVVLNSPDPKSARDENPSLAHSKSLAPWLEGQLDNDKLGTFTIHHHPIWSYGRTGIDPALAPWETLYHTYNISANFAGHIHTYQRYSVKGIPYFVVANAGGSFVNMNKGAKVAKWYEYGATRQLGYLRVTVDPEHNTATAQAIFVAYVETNDSETATVYDPPIIADAVTFPLSSQLSTLTVTKSGLGSGTVASTPSVIDCGSTCNASFKNITRVTFTPTPDKGSVFTGWTDACRGHGQCSVTMRPGADTAVGAVFEKGSCTHSISPTTRTLTYRGGNITIDVKAKGYAYCRTPEIENNTDWITYTATPFVNNRESVVLSIPKYDNSTGRSGTLTIGGQTFTVTQKGKP